MSAAADLTPTAAIDPAATTDPPDQTAPAPPPFQRLPRQKALGLRKATATQKRVAKAAATELSSSTTWEEDFTNKAPEREPLAVRLKNAAEWAMLLAAARLWLAFVNAKALLYWDATFNALDPMRDEFELALKRDPSVADRYPALASFFAQRKLAADRARRTKKNNKAAGGTSAPPAPAAPATGSQG